MGSGKEGEMYGEEVKEGHVQKGKSSKTVEKDMYGKEVVRWKVLGINGKEGGGCLYGNNGGGCMYGKEDGGGHDVRKGWQRGCIIP